MGWVFPAVSALNANAVRAEEQGAAAACRRHAPPRRAPAAARRAARLHVQGARDKALDRMHAAESLAKDPVPEE